MWFISAEDLVLAKLLWAKESYSEIMKDTSDAVTVRFKNMIMRRNPVERLLMGCSMFDTAKRISKSAIIQQHPGISPEKMKEEIFLKFYGMEFSEADKEKILNVLRNYQCNSVHPVR